MQFANLPPLESDAVIAPLLAGIEQTIQDAIATTSQAGIDAVATALPYDALTQVAWQGRTSPADFPLLCVYRETDLGVDLKEQRIAASFHLPPQVDLASLAGLRRWLAVVMSRAIGEVVCDFDFPHRVTSSPVATYPLPLIQGQIYPSVLLKFTVE